MTALVTGITVREAMVSELIALAHEAHRMPYVVRKFTTDRPTEWDQIHEVDINRMLDMLVGG